MSSSNHREPAANGSERRGAPASTPDLGTKLRRAREAKGLSLQHIANTTKISVASLEALEQNAFARLPRGLFTRAFIRSYAAEVGIDPEEAVRDFLVQVPPVGPSEFTPHEAIEGGDFEARLPEPVTLAVGLFVLFAIGMSVYFVLRPGGVTPQQATAQVEAGAVDAQPAPVPLTPPPASSGEPAPVGTAGRVGRGDLELPSAPEPLTVELAPTAPCWISATVDGKPAFARTLSAGDREVLKADRDILLRIGNAGAFVYRINGQPGRLLGAAGEVVLVRIAPETVLDFIEP